MVAVAPLARWEGAATAYPPRVTSPGQISSSSRPLARCGVSIPRRLSVMMRRRAAAICTRNYSLDQCTTRGFEPSLGASGPEGSSPSRASSVWLLLFDITSSSRPPYATEVTSAAQQGHEPDSQRTAKIRLARPLPANRSSSDSRRGFTQNEWRRRPLGTMPSFGSTGRHLSARRGEATLSVRDISTMGSHRSGHFTGSSATRLASSELKKEPIASRSYPTSRTVSAVHSRTRSSA